MPSRQFYTYKFKSSKLKELNWNITTTFEEAQSLGEIVSLGDSQMLRSIRSIRHRTINYTHLEHLIAERKLLHRKGTDPSRYSTVVSRLTRTLFIPDYVTILMEHPSHYTYLFKNGFTLNNTRYRRFSCSPGQARVSTVVFCAEDIIPSLSSRLNNNRNPSIPLAPSKFNAYFGLCTSATHVVSPPSFTVVPDYSSPCTYKANFVTEQDWHIDDTVDQREITVQMNRADGMGLISPSLASKWAADLGLDYVPSQFVIRQSFIKGLVCVFPIQEFCSEHNIHTTTDVWGNQVDLSSVDLILSESQFKLWDSYSSQSSYTASCIKNGLYWGVTQFSPKTLKNTLTLNYQFIQTLNLNQSRIESLCSYFINWIDRVSLSDPYYMLLFLLGPNISKESLSRAEWWIKALAVNPSCAADPYIRAKIRDLMINRIQSGCVGEVIVPGNFQFMVSDPYAFMQHVCDLPITGLLGPNEFYSHYWNDRRVTQVDTMRSPLMYRCEHIIANLIRNEETERWYRYCTTGFIINWHGHETVNWGGADFDGDILASTNTQAIIDSVYRNELTVTYDAPKPTKKLFTEEDLYKADLFSFGSIIGSITNKASNCYALLPNLYATYGPDSPEVQLAESRLRQSCVAQSKQIDMAKIGQPVKGIPDVWVRRTATASLEEPYKTVCQHILLDRYPYFFKHRYPKAKKDYQLYEAQKQASCKQTFGKTIKQLESMPRKTPAQIKWLDDYYAYCPLVISNSPMNLLCFYLESIDFNILTQLKKRSSFDAHMYFSDTELPKEYPEIIECYKRHMREMNQTFTQDKEERDRVMQTSIHRLKERLSYICPDANAVTNALVHYLYIEKPSSNKDIFWEAYGAQLIDHAASSPDAPLCPMIPAPDPEGPIEYLGDHFSLTEVVL